MRVLLAVFLGMFFYGLWSAKLGAGLLSLGMYLFLLWAEGKFAAQDKAYNADPRNARPVEPPTSVAATEYDCEYTRSRF